MKKEQAEEILARVAAAEAALQEVRDLVKGAIGIAASSEVRERMCLGKRRYRTLKGAGASCPASSG